MGGLVIGSVLVTFLVLANFTRGLVGMFTFLTLLSTLSSLFPYVICSMGGIVLARRKGGPAPFFRGERVIASIAFLYAMWAIGGAGQETVFWGFLLILAGLPIYVWVTRTGRTPRMIDDGSEEPGS